MATKKVQHKRKDFDPLGDSHGAHLLNRAIVNTIHEPFIVLDENLQVIVASASFLKKFNLAPKTTHRKNFCEIGNGAWCMEPLCAKLAEIIPKHKSLDRFEIEYLLPGHTEPRTFLVSGREIHQPGRPKKILLSFFDVTDERALEAEREVRLAQKDLLLKEMSHRIANSLQLIASILLLKAAVVNSKESRAHLQDAHERIMTIASVQQQLDPVMLGEKIVVGRYLTTLCKSLARSMIAGKKPITVRVSAGAGSVSSDTAVSFGLITTELVINALKHAFKLGQKGIITVTFSSQNENWALSVADDGVGVSARNKKGARRGLGTSIIGALANQLHATIHTDSTPHGTTVTLTHEKI